MPSKYEKYYRVLDLDVGASQDEVKKAFRELSHIWHPDNHMGKSSNVENRATEKFKELSNAYQVLKEYLRAEEKKKAEQDEREREGKERKQREENERQKKAEQDRRDREEKERKFWEEQAKKKQEEEKERKYWEEQVKKKHKEEKSKKIKKEYIFVSCPKCKKNIIANTTENLSRTCESCGHVYYYYFEDGELKVVSYSKEDRRRKEQAYGKERANSLHKEAQKKTETIETADYTWGWGWAFIVIFVIPPLLLVVIIFALLLFL